jgi:mannose-6-phosphate isomerase-like protein (cupin superfamily)
MARYKAGDVMAVPDGYGFNILSDRNRPLVTLEFSTRDEAKQARDEIAKVVVKAVTITPHS